MPAPRVFISSTCYDLKYIRENLKFFIRTVGYEPILSEEGSVFYDPILSTQDACLAEVPACQMFVLIIGGRYGSRYKNTDKSITNAEYQEAIKAKIPIFALVERGVFDQYRVFLSNKENPSVDHMKISYPAVDSTRIFDFIEEVQEQAVNNALVPFSDFEEMRTYLKQQWAGMMYRFLTSESEAKRLRGIVSALSGAQEKIEFLTRKVVDAVADPTAKLAVELYDFLFDQAFIHELMGWGLHPSPKEIMQHETLDDFCKGKMELRERPDWDKSWLALSDSPPMLEISTERLSRARKTYQKIRETLLERLDEKRISVDDFLKGV